ncbi:helix-turn-helix transcriptional regulator [Sphingopyxis sp.]|uniref:helix-turn-helix transcriptional regulator n=1 Tax=Sphingopyxis sp. TaxID=1908224 RepID=UPI002D79BFEA|nr:helix-turn-helix transcriptional regulator [Sphingopyxis sp.]HET6523576.1 helix-turn-helix transcriptional regulator [Sphingopyxis sp.]
MGDSGSQMTENQMIWERLTERHRACLDLLLDHKTSKQIARELDIAKDTVDQRITAARNILGASDRNEAAIRYRHLKSIYYRIAYDPVEMAGEPQLVPSNFANGRPSRIKLGESAKRMDELSGASLSFGTIWRPGDGPGKRIMIMVALLLVTIIAISLGLGIAQSLTQLLSG